MAESAPGGLKEISGNFYILGFSKDLHCCWVGKRGRGWVLCFGVNRTRRAFRFTLVFDAEHVRDLVQAKHPQYTFDVWQYHKDGKHEKIE